LYVLLYHSWIATDITGESYEFKRLDLSNEEDKAYFEGAMAWELTVDGKEWADGKNFK
jgi:elongation factor 1-gamma